MAIEIADPAPVDQPLSDAPPLPRPNDIWTRVRRRSLREFPKISFIGATVRNWLLCASCCTVSRDYAFRMYASSNWCGTYTTIWDWIWRLWILCCDIETRSGRCSGGSMNWINGCAKRRRSTILKSWRFAGNRRRHGLKIRSYLNKFFGSKLFYEIPQRKGKWLI